MKKKSKQSKDPFILKIINLVGEGIALLPKALFKSSEALVIGLENLINSKYDEKPSKTINSVTNKSSKIEENISNDVKKTKKPNLSFDKSIKPEYVPFTIEEQKSGSYEDFEDFIFNQNSTIGIILGKRGSGKSAIGLKILENINAKISKKCYAMGFDESTLPWFIESIEDISEIKNDSFILIDEGGILFSSRNAMSTPNKILSELILIARHKDLSILFISQNSSNLDVNIIRQADYLILKPSSLLQKDFERKVIKNIYEAIKSDYLKYSKKKGITYIHADSFNGFVTNPLPSFWSNNLSKSFKNFAK